MSDESNIVEQCLEPLACADLSITMDRALLVQTSIAVSLKRIADALAPADGTDIGTILFYAGQAIEMAANR